MRNRWLCIAVTILEALWLNVVVPGHKRGCIQLPGAPDVAACPLCDSAPASHPSKSPVPTNRADTCAICFFAAHLSIPPAIDLTPPPLQLVGLAQSPRVRNLVARLVQIPFDGRGPPACA